MLVQVGLPKSSVARKMHSEGVVTSVLEAVEVLSLDPEGAVPIFKQPSANISGASGENSLEGRGGDSTANAAVKDIDAPMMPLGQHPRYDVGKNIQPVAVVIPTELREFFICSGFYKIAVNAYLEFCIKRDPPLDTPENVFGTSLFIIYCHSCLIVSL